MPTNTEELQDLVLAAARDVAEQFAPDETAYFDDFVKDIYNKKHKTATPLAFGLSDALVFLTPHILSAYEHAGPALLALGYSVVTDVSKDVLKTRLKDWLSNLHKKGPKPIESKLIRFETAVETTEKTLCTAGLDESRRHQLALAIVGSLLLASNVQIGVDNEQQR